MSAQEDNVLGRIPVGIAVLAVGLVGLVLAGLRFGAPGVVLGLAALTLVGVITAFWTSLRTLLGETRLTGADAYAIGAPRVEEEQKRAALRALKDLEFERAVGKISEEAAKVPVSECRREAKRLLRMLDEASADQRARAERVVAQRFAELGLGPLDQEQDAAASETQEGSAEPAETRTAAKAEEKVVESAAAEEDEEEDKEKKRDDEEADHA